MNVVARVIRLDRLASQVVVQQLVLLSLWLESALAQVRYIRLDIVLVLAFREQVMLKVLGWGNVGRNADGLRTDGQKK